MTTAAGHTSLGSQLQLLLMLMLAIAAAAAAAAVSCPPGSADCVIADLPQAIAGADLFGGLSDATRRLTVRGVSLRDWPTDEALRAAGRAGQLERLELDGVRLAGELPSQLQLSGQALAGLRSLRISGGSGSCPFSGAGVASFEWLQELSISGCRIGAPLTGAWLKELPRLQRLTVENAKVDGGLHLAGLDRRTRESLRQIRLASNSFTILANDSFGQMPNLANLTLDGNIIQYIQPMAFTQLPSLVELSISLPKEGQLAKIWEASLDGRFDNNTKLQTLRLVNARLAEEQIPRSFDQLKDLRVLDLSGHRFRRLHNSVLSSLTKLEQLDLSNGSLVCLYDRNFGVMSSLRRLNLAGNSIRVIAKRALLGLPSLTSLDLSDNPVEAIELGAFCTLRPELKDSPGLLAGWGLDAGRVEGAANVSEPCPADFNPHRLILSSRPQCALPRAAGNGSAGNGGGGDAKRSPGQSSHTFLIIIGLCVAFLLVTVISMMAYKGWSKRKNTQLAKDEEKELELQAMVAAAEEGGAAGGGGGASTTDAGGKKPQNGRHHRHHHHGAGKSDKKPSPSSAQPPPPPPPADGGAGAETDGAAGASLEITAQVESPERCSSGQDANSQQPQPAQQSPSNDSDGASKQQQQPQQQQQPPQMRPGITPMTTVPEDSDLEARAITTLVVV